jgi:predicted RNase H-like HicB family nuclease
VNEAVYSPLHKAWLVCLPGNPYVYAYGKSEAGAKANAKARREKEKKVRWGAY